MSVKWTKTNEAIFTLESKLKCLICEKLQVEPQLLWCKHSFCSTCVQNKLTCPQCQFPITPQEMVPNIMLNKLLKALKAAMQISKCNEEQNDDEVNPASVPSPKKDLHSANVTDKGIYEKGDDFTKLNNPVKSAKNKNCERKNSEAAEKESHSLTNEINVRAVRKCRISGRHSSPPKVKQELSEAFKKSTRNISPQKEKLETSDTKKSKAALHNSPKAQSKENNVMSTPKPKQQKVPKSSTPILFSAKKVPHTNKVNKVNSKGETPLQIACRKGKLNLVEQLLREGAKPNVKDYANWTPLCDAVGSGSVEVVRTLLEAGAAVNTPANLNTTALVEAVVRKDKAMVQLLLDHGADMHQRTALNNTALSLADDDIRALMLNCNYVSPPPPPLVPTTPRAVLVDAQLPPPQLNQVMELCRKFNLTLSTEFTEDITHLVVEKSIANTCKASTFVMLAIVSGCSVVGVDWVAACLKAEKLVALDEFEPCGTIDYPSSDVFHKARLNKEHLLPRLFDGCHISLQQDQSWPRQLKADTITLVTATGAVYQPRQCDPERVPQAEATVMYHTAPAGPLGVLSHVILYQAGPPAQEPLLKYNMAHVKSLSLSWFHKSILTFSIKLD